MLQREAGNAAVTALLHAVQRQPAPETPDEKDAAFRADNPDLAKLDPKNPVQANEDAVRAVVVAAFGSEQAVEDAFNGLAPEVRAQVDSHTPKTDAAALAANHVQFLVRMRLYFDSWADLLDHFSPAKIERVTDGPVDVFLHADAAARLRRVLTVMKNKNHPLPTIGVGFGLRGFYKGDFQHPGFMVHAMGFAVDIAARENPKIFTPRARTDPGRHDPVQIAAKVGADAMHIKMRFQDTAVIAAMGTRTADNPNLSAADDPDPAARDYFQRFEQGFQRMQQGSSAFVDSLSFINRSVLLAIRDQYFETLEAIKAEKAKGVRADSKKLEKLNTDRRDLLSLIPPLTSGWIKVLDDEIAKTIQNHPGIENLRSPAELRRGIADANAAIGKGRGEAARTLAAKARAVRVSDAAGAAAYKIGERLNKTAEGPARVKVRAETKAAFDRYTETMKARSAATDAEFKARQAVKTSTHNRDELVAELKKVSAKDVIGAWTWLDNLRFLRHLLQAPDLSSAAGLKEYESVTTGDLSRKAPVENPPLLRLLDKGFFNPTGAFDLAFFEEMAHSGFWPGATWEAGHADPMHFELFEGRTSIKVPGTFPK